MLRPLPSPFALAEGPYHPGSAEFNPTGGEVGVLMGAHLHQVRFVACDLCRKGPRTITWRTGGHYGRALVSAQATRRLWDPLF